MFGARFGPKIRANLAANSRTKPERRPVPAIEWSTSRTERSTFGGAAVETQKSYQNGPDGAVSSTEQKVVRPDGSSETTWRQEWSGAVPAPYMPPPPPYGSSTTTTTTVR